MCKEKIKLSHHNLAHILLYISHTLQESHTGEGVKKFWSAERASKHTADDRPAGDYAAMLVMPQDRSARRTHSGKRKQSTRWSIAMPAACMKE
jgi:hypothetical protein